LSVRGRTWLSIAFLALCLGVTPSCLFRSRRVEVTRSSAPLKSATQDELAVRINDFAASVHSLNATVDIDTTVGGAKKGKVVEYQQIRGYVLALKPELLRMVGLLPFVHNRAFDMVSNGERFELSIPPKNRFITGTDQVTKISKNPLENMRPQVIYDSLLIPPVDRDNEIAVLEEGLQKVKDAKSKKMVDQPNYVLLIIGRDKEKSWRLKRKFYFNRADLSIYRQTVFDENGAEITDVVYSGYQIYDKVEFPSLVEINRPQEEYRIAIKMVKLNLNTKIEPEKFKLERPKGAKVTELK
jgi:outer membrane lipoprotein-sorting protein